MSVKVMSWVWEYSRSTKTDRLVLLAIADCASEDGSNAYPSMAELARKTGLSPRAVQYAIKYLVGLGELFVGVNSGPRGCNRYRVVMTEGVQAVHPANGAPLQTVQGANGSGVQTVQGAESAPVQATTDLDANGAPGTVRTVQKKSSTKTSKPKIETDEESLGQRVNRLTRTYTDRVKLSNFNAVAGVVRKAVNAHVTDDLITHGLNQLADDNRAVTVDSLRYAIYGVPPARSPGTAVAVVDKRSTGAQRAGAGIEIANRMRKEREDAERGTV